MSMHLLLTTPMEEMLAEVNFPFSLLWQGFRFKEFLITRKRSHKPDECISPAELQNVNFLRTNVRLGYRFLYAIVNP